MPPSGWVGNLRYAVESNNVAAVRSLLKKGADINHAFGKNKMTALCKAVWRRYKDMVKMLLAAGCDVHHSDDQGETALFLAVRRGFADMARLLVEGGCEVNHRNTAGRTVAHVAVAEGRTATLEYLLSVPCDVNIVDNSRHTPLSLAMSMHWEALKTGDEGAQTKSKRGSALFTQKNIDMLIPLTDNLEHLQMLRRSQSVCGAQNGHFGIPLALVQHGAKVDHAMFDTELEIAMDACFKPFSFSPNFAKLLVLAGADTFVMIETPMLAEMAYDCYQRYQNQCYKDLFIWLEKQASVPLSLQNLCRINIRQLFRGRAGLWEKLDKLPVTHPIIDFLKFKNVSTDDVVTLT